MKYNRREPVDCRALGLATAAWFYVNEGSITVVCGGSGGQAVLTRRQLVGALKAMRKPRRSGSASESQS